MKSMINKGIVAVLLGVAMLGMVYATAIDQTTGQGSAIPANSKTPVILSGTMDCTKSNSAAGDTYKIIKVPSNTWVIAAWYSVYGTNADTSVVNIGDSSVTNRWKTGLSMQTMEDGAMCNYTNAQVYYTSDDYVNIQIVDNSCTNGKLRVKLLVVPLNQDR